MAGGKLRAVVELVHRVAAGQQLREEADSLLLERFARHRDEVAFARLLRRHGPMVLAVCRRLLRHSQDAEDAFQATFLVLARRAGSIGRPQQLAGWLHGVATRTARKARVLAARRRALERPLGNMDCPAPAGPPSLGFGSVLDEEIGRLPEKYRTAVVLCYLQGKTTAEAGQEMRCPRGTVLSRLAWARQRLRVRLSRRGVALSAALTALLAEGGRAAAAAVLTEPTLSAALAFMTQPITAAAAATPAAALARGVLRSMMLSKTVVLSGLLLTLAALPVGLCGWQGPGAGAAPTSSLAAEVRFGPANRDFEERADEPENAARDWVALSSRESKAAPALAVHLAGADGKPKTFRAAADAMVISYLADRQWGHLPWLALDLADHNRTLLRFDPKLDGKVAKAELVLHFAEVGEHPTPARPFDVAIHEIKEAWDEATVKWDNQPAFEDKPAATVRIDPKAKEVRLDVTRLVQRLADKAAPGHGWLLKVAKPLEDQNP
jgi:DNA-directed RNA polymerase specialized sigma24 family protein